MSKSSDGNNHIVFMTDVARVVKEKPIPLALDEFN